MLIKVNFNSLYFIQVYNLKVICDDVITSIACVERIFVEHTILIDSSTLPENCVLEIQTQESRILALSVINGDLKQIQEFLAV